MLLQYRFFTRNSVLTLKSNACLRLPIRCPHWIKSGCPIALSLSLFFIFGCYNTEESFQEAPQFLARITIQEDNSLDLDDMAMGWKDFAEITDAKEIAEIHIPENMAVRIELFDKGLSVPGLLQSLATENIRAIEIRNEKTTPRDEDIVSALKGMASLESIWVLPSDVTGSFLADIECQESLRELRILFCPFSDEASPHLERFSRLENLDLYSSNIGDLALQYISTLSNLTILGLYGTKITDAGLPLLAKLEKLETLMLSGTDISDDGIKSLKPLRNLMYLGADGPRITRDCVPFLFSMENLLTANFSVLNPLEQSQFRDRRVAAESKM